MFGHGLLSHNVLVYVAFLMVATVWFFLERTRPGLRLRAAAVARVNLRYDDTPAKLVYDEEYEAVQVPLAPCELAS